MTTDDKVSFLIKTDILNVTDWGRKEIDYQNLPKDELVAQCMIKDILMETFLDDVANFMLSPNLHKERIKIWLRMHYNKH